LFDQPVLLTTFTKTVFGEFFWGWRRERAIIRAKVEPIFRNAYHYNTINEGHWREWRDWRGGTEVMRASQAVLRVFRRPWNRITPMKTATS